MDITAPDGAGQRVTIDGHLYQGPTVVTLLPGDINAVADAGITRGCNPPANDNYCPDDSFTRGQAAAFISRALGY